MTVGERIKLRRKELKISADEIAKEIGVSRSTIFRYEKGDIEKMPTNVLDSIAKFLKTTPGVLMGWEDNKSDINTIYNKLNYNRKQEVYSFAKNQLEEQNSNIVDLKQYQDVYIHSKVSASRGIVNLNQQNKELISYKGYVPKKYDLAFEVSGDSMTPLFKDGEIIFIEYDKEVRNGQIGVVMIDDEAYVKKMYVEDNHLRLVSLNKEYDDIIADKDIKIVGRAII